MKKVLFFIYAIIITQLLTAQAPAIEWQNTIGGNDYEYLYAVEQTTDGGYILGGESRSELNGDKTEVNVGSTSSCDFWVVKISLTGSIEWQNTIGGTGQDHLYSIKQTSDGGYILGGNSTSGINGDKTEAYFGGSFYGDYWVIKLNSAGIIEWQNTIGGPDEDKLKSIIQTNDGGYLLGGFSESGVGGDKTEPSNGLDDFWIIKLNSAGSIEWQNTIGGSGDDQVSVVLQNNDGNFIAAGHSISGISGDKTEGVVGGTVYADYWILELNNAGDLIWQKTIGGSSTDRLKSIKQTLDGGYIMGGYSTSSISPNKSESNYGYGDYWIIKLNVLREIEWENTIGGTDIEELSELEQTTDGGYILAGSSESPIGFDKTEMNFGPTNHADDYWIVKLDAAGTVMWDNTIGGNKSDYLHAIAETEDGGFILAGNSESYASGDKTENTVGGGLEITDYWVVKIEGNCMVAPEICNSLDDNCNGLIDDGITESISISAGGDTTFCQGGNVILSAAYSGTSLQWKKNGVNIPGATSSTYIVNVKGTYTCETTSPCDVALSSQIIVNVLKNPTASISAGGATTFCAGGSVTLTETPVAGCTYQWYKGVTPIAGATSLTYAATTSGNYKCRVTKTATGCYKNSNSIAVSVPCKEGLPAGETGEMMNGEDAFSIFPNPNNGSFNISGSISNETVIEIVNSLGQLIYTKKLNSLNYFTEAISINNFVPGIYFVRLTNEVTITEQKMIIE